MMCKKTIYLAVPSAAFLLISTVNAGVVCPPDPSTAFVNQPNTVYAVSYPSGAGPNTLYSYCSNLTNETAIATLNSCGAIQHPIDGIGYNPQDNFMYGVMPTDSMGIGAHLDLTELPFGGPGSGDIMVADPVAIFRIGNDGGYGQIGVIDPAPETAPLPGENQVTPIMYNVSTFDSSGNMHMLGYRTDYTSQAFPPEVNYISAEMMIGTVTNADIQAANGGTIPATWSDVDVSGDAVCGAVVDAFRAHTNTFSACVVNAYLNNGNNGDAAVDSCLNLIEDKGINDFAVSPTNGFFYAYDTATYADRDVLIEVNPGTMVASCTEVPDAGNQTSLLTSLMYTAQNNLVGILANNGTGVSINTVSGVSTPLTANQIIMPEGFGDGASQPFALAPFLRGLASNLIFRDGFEPELIFANGFEGMIMPVCPDF